MDVVRLGRSIRALRRRRGWTQARLGEAVGLSRATVSRIETGGAGALRLDAIVRVGDVLDARVDVALRWHGEGLDRLLDAAHAGLVERAVAALDKAGWESVVEVTFARYGERGSIDVLAWHRATRTVLVVEVKSVIPDLQGMLSALDRKTRLAPSIARERGWGRPEVVGRLLILPASRTIERRLAMHGATFGTALPDRGHTVRSWIDRRRTGPMSGILLLPPDSHPASTRRRPQT
jgi:transcriptional regulator with XRE-family HTH domain